MANQNERQEVGEMNNLKSTARCHECGSVMEGKKGEYRYSECGLTSVILKDILVFRCTNCNEVIPEIPAVGVLHRVIALRLLDKKNLLTGSEIRFLRKLCGYTVNEFAEIIGSTKTVISRWEKDGCGKGTDRLVRLLVMSKLAGELAGQPEPILSNMTVAELISMVEDSLKLMEGKGRANEQYQISPVELARFSGTSDRQMSGELVGSVQ